MTQQGRRGVIRDAGIGGVVALLIGVLTACAGPGGDGLSTISAASTVGGTLTTATPSGTRAASTGSAAASTGTTASNTVAAAVGSSAASPNAAGSAAARTPAAVMNQTPGAGSATSATRPVTTGSTTPGAASATTRPATTTGSTTPAAGAGTATRTGAATVSRAAGTMTASTGAPTIPAPPSGTEYVKGTNPIIDTILQGASEGLNSSGDTVMVTSTKNYTTTSSAADVVAFYQMQMPTLGWTPEQNQAASSGITTLVYSRDNQTNAALLLVVDLSQVGQKGCLVITALAKPK